MSDSRDMSHAKAQPMEEIKHEVIDPKAIFTDEVAHFHHKGLYYATFQYLAADNRWWGWGGVPIGFYRTISWWPGLRVRADMEFFGQHRIYEGPIRAGQTLAIWGTIFEPVGGVFDKAEAMHLLETGTTPVYAPSTRE
jgi:hypothetical protein